MIKSKRIAEWVKTALIVLLTASAMILGWRTALFNDFFNSIPFLGNIAGLVAGSTPAAPAVSMDAEAVRPLTIVVTDDNGIRHGIKYDVVERNNAYDRISSIFAEALGSMAEPVEISEETWRTALFTPGVYFEYIMPVRLSVLDGWLGVRMPEFAEDISLRRIFVAFSGDTNRIYFEDAVSGIFYGADTVSARSIQEMYSTDPNGAVFAFETGLAVAENAPYMLIMPGNTHPFIRAMITGSAQEHLATVLFAFGLENETIHSSYDSDGARRYLGTHFNIRVESNGRVTYRLTGGVQMTEGYPLKSESEMIEVARAIVADTISGHSSGEAEIFFEKIEQDSGNSFSVTFGYYIAGGRVHLFEDGHAARITFSDGVVVEAELIFRNFSVITGEYATLLPEKQALAAAGGEFMLSFPYAGAEKLMPSWIKYGFGGSDF
ncbi:MAG: hypothetical protein FWC90_03925 [Oscillospiraceae bacterium]|nr:hypothetical protein [Oscillospiraceae bacterium]